MLTLNIWIACFNLILEWSWCTNFININYGVDRYLDLGIQLALLLNITKHCIVCIYKYNTGL